MDITHYIFITSLCACVIIPIVLLLRLCLKKAPKWVNVLLWGIVALAIIIAPVFDMLISTQSDTQDTSPGIENPFPPNNYTEISPMVPPYREVPPTENPSNTDTWYKISNFIYSALYTTVYPFSAFYHEGIVPTGTKILNCIKAMVGQSDVGFYNTMIAEHYEIILTLWGIGVLSMLSYTAVSYWRLRRKIATAVRLIDNIYQSENVGFPFVLGFFKPRIYLPFKISLQDIEYVIAHEQAHIQRRDHWWKPFGFLLLTIHWFNPLMWIAYVLLCRDIELACDEKVIQSLGNEQKADYTQALVTCSVKRHMVTACPLAFGSVGVKDRVKAVMNYKKPTARVMLLSIIVCSAVFMLSLTFAFIVAHATHDVAQSAEPAKEPPVDPPVVEPPKLLPYYPDTGGCILFDLETGTIVGYEGNPGKFVIPSEINGVPVVGVADGKIVRLIPSHTIYYPVLGGGLLFDPASGTIIGYIGTPTKFKIPAKINGIPVVAIDSGAFRFCDSLSHVTISEGVKSIGVFAFAHCPNLRYMKLPDSLKSIGNLAFRLCESLTLITLPEGLESIGNEAFAYSGLTSITIPKNVMLIGSGAFSMCSSLKAIRVDEANPYYSSDENGVLFNKARTILHTYPAALRGRYTIPSGVTRIGAYAFSGCSLRRINIPDSVTVIGTAAFNHCSNLTNITLPHSIESIDNSAFAKCSSLAKITIPASTVSIGNNVFSGCNNLTDIYFGGSARQWALMGNNSYSYGNTTIHYNAT